MLTLSEAFIRECENDESSPAVLVEIVGASPSKYLMATRPMFGYRNIVKKVTGRQSGLDPLKCTQKLNSISIDFQDDAPGSDIRDALVALQAFNKKVILKLGFDTGSDATFSEGSFAPYCTGLVDRIENEPGIVRIVLRDTKSVMFERKGMTTTIPAGDVVQNGEIPPFKYAGAYTSAMLQMITDTNMGSPELYDAASYAPAASPRTGHFTVQRLGNNRISEPENLEKLLDEIAVVVRGYNLVQEDGIMRWKEFDPTAASLFRFTEADIIPESVRITQDFSSLVYTVSVNSGYSDDGGYAMQLRASDAAGQAAWAYSDASTRKSDFVINDKWFGQLAMTFNGERVDQTATNIRIVANSFAGAQNSPDYGTNPNATDATDEGLLFIRGVQLSGDPANPGEFIKYQTITKVSGSNPRRYLVDNITRGQLGTTARHHNTTLDGPRPLLRDVSAPVRGAQEIIKRFREGATTIEFQTPLHMYAVQLSDVGNIEHPVFMRYGLDGLGVGNTIKFETVQKEVDLEEGVITWKFVEIRTASHTSLLDRFGGALWAVNPGIFANLGSSGSLAAVGFAHLPLFADAQTATNGGLVKCFIDGSLPVDPGASLVMTTPWQRLATRDGIVIAPEESHTYTASKDTYLDVDPHPAGLTQWIYEEVANGAAAPAIATGNKRAFKVVTNGSEITGVTDLRDVALVDLGPNVKDQNIGAVPGYKRTELVSALPAAGTIGRVKIETASETLWRDTGTEWVPIGGGFNDAQFDIDATVETGLTISGTRKRMYTWNNIWGAWYSRGTWVASTNLSSSHDLMGSHGTPNTMCLVSGRTAAGAADKFCNQFSGSVWQSISGPANNMYSRSGTGRFLVGTDAGGNTGAAASTEVVLFSGTSWSAGQALPLAREAGALFGTRGDLIFAGGYNAGGVTTVYGGNGTQTTWATKGALNASVFAAGKIGRANAGLLTGGATGAGGAGNIVSTTTVRTGADVWWTFNSLNTARHYHGHGGTFYDMLVVGGLDNVGPTAIATCEKWQGSSWSFSVSQAAINMYRGQTGGSMATSAGGAVAGAVSAASEKWIGDVMIEAFAVFYGKGDCEVVGELSGKVGTDFYTDEEGDFDILVRPALLYPTNEASRTELIEFVNIDPGDGKWTAITAMTGSRSEGPGFGRPSAFVIASGVSGGARINTSEKWNGSAWSNAGNVVTARNSGNAAGVLNAGVFFFGFKDPGPAVCNNTETYDGSTWTSVGAAGGTARAPMFGVVGRKNACISACGFNGAAYSQTVEKFNGATWSALASSGTSRGEGGIYGTQFACVLQGSEAYINTPFEYMGGAWKASGYYMIRGRRWAPGVGHVWNALVISGELTGPVTTASVERFNVFGVHLADNVIAGVESCGVAGIGSYCLQAGGNNSAGTAQTAAAVYQTEIAIPSSVGVLANLFYSR